MKLSNGINFAKYGFVSFGFLLLLGINIENAEGKQRKRTKRVSSHGHSHGHGHGHAEPSPWILGAGVSVSKGIGSSSSSGGEGESGGDHSGHAHLTEDTYALDDGHAHDEGGGESGSSGGSGIEPTFSALVGYRITKKIAANLGLSFGTSSGISDPLVGMDFKLPKMGKLKSSVIPSFTVPASTASTDSYKITTISTTWNPSFKSGKMLYSGSTGLAKSYYSKTIIVEEEAANVKAPGRQSLNLTQDDHDHEDEGFEVEGESLDTGDREFDRYSLNTSAGYTFSKNVLTGFGLGMAMVTKQFGPSQIETSATILKVTYLWNSIATSLSLGLSESQESFAVPKNPNVSLGLFYSYE